MCPASGELKTGEPTIWYVYLLYYTNFLLNYIAAFSISYRQAGKEVQTEGEPERAFASIGRRK